MPNQTSNRDIKQDAGFKSGIKERSLCHRSKSTMNQTEHHQGSQNLQEKKSLRDESEENAKNQQQDQKITSGVRGKPEEKIFWKQQREFQVNDNNR